MMLNAKKSGMIMDRRVRNSLYYILIVLMAWGLKCHYSRAGSGELAWIMAPTAGLVELVSGIPFENETHTGFVSRSYRIVIAPACAGINFMIIAFCMTAFAGVGAFERHCARLLWMGSGCLSAYLLTIAVNTARIIVSIYSTRMDAGPAWMTAARLHRLEGVVIYFFFLSLFYMIMKRVVCRFGGECDCKKTAIGPFGNVKKRHCLESTFDYFRRACTVSIPWFWYGLVTLGVPLVNGAWQADATRFTEHGVTVLAGCSAVGAAFFLLRAIGSKIIIGRLSKIIFAAWRQAIHGDKQIQTE